MKKTLVSLGAVAVSLAMASTAFAAQNVGSNSSLSFSSSMYTKTSVNNTNSAMVSNSVSSSANSGNVSFMAGHGDIIGTNVVTGNATTNTTVSNQVNSIDSTVTAPSNCGCETVVAPVDQNAGSNSTVSTHLSQKDKVYVNNTNELGIDNALSSASNTGSVAFGAKHGDIKSTGVSTGVSGTMSTLGTIGNITSSLVTR